MSGKPVIVEETHLSLFTKDHLRKLMYERSGPCISIFMPTHRGGAETQQDQIRFKNLLREAEKRLTTSCLRSTELEGFLQGPRALLQNSLFWGHQSDGLAIFLSPHTFGYYRVPVDFKELVVVADRFHIKPLLPLISGDGRFYVLALSQSQCRLFHGSRYSVVDVDLEGVPGSLSDVLPNKDLQKQFHFHTGTPGTQGERAAIFHGHGTGTTDNKEKMLQYFRTLDRRLHEVLRDEQAPLVMAGVEFLLPIYRQANTYPYLVEEGASGNPEGLSAEELHGQAWNVVEPYFRKARDEAMAQYRQVAATKRSSCDVKAIVRSAYYGRVELLFAAIGLQTWGTFDLATNTVHLRDEAGPGDSDLLDFAAIHTLLNGGTVYGVEADEVPDHAPLAAVFRY